MSAKIKYTYLFLKDIQLQSVSWYLATSYLKFYWVWYYPFPILWCTWGAVVGCEPKFEMTSEILWVTSSQIRSSLVKKNLRELYLAKTEFDLRKTESEMTSLRGFLTSSQISVHILLLHPKCITISGKGNISSITLS